MGSAQSFQFEAETQHLLDLMIHSLYTNKEIFLRELISNASDAIDRLRFESLTRPELVADTTEFEINLIADRANRTLTVSDNGIGMSRDEVIANIGTIARSGTRELRERMQKTQPGPGQVDLIGQFGVGFYSAFMVAEKVELITRRAGESTATAWESNGGGNYTLSEAERPTHGTTIILHLKPSDPESGIEDFTDNWIVSRIVKRYSDFVSYPIIFKASSLETEKDEGAESDLAAERKTLNSMKPLWTRPQSEVSESEYSEFYKHITHNWDEPLKVISLKAEGRLEYQALLFIPSQAPHDLFYHGSETGVRLYAKRVMIMERCEELLPRYLRFIKGMVDSSDLPLNISRQMLQQDRHIAQIRKWLTKKILSELHDMFEKDFEKYLAFWSQFGRALKEGVSSDYDNKDAIISLLLFESSNHSSELTSLKHYFERMKADQDDIYYLTGESRSVVENSPHLEAFKEKGYEVLYLTDPVDELLVQALTEFEGKKLKSVGKGVVKLGSEQEKEEAEKELSHQEQSYSDLLSFMQKALDEQVKQVRLTNRLVTSPVCLVGSEMDYSPQLERLLQMGKGGGPKQRRIMELNPRNEIVQKMFDRFKNDPNDAALVNYAELLFGYALLAEGSELPDPVRFNRLVADIMLQSLK